MRVINLVAHNSVDKVESAVGSQVRPMDVSSVASKLKTGDEFIALIRNTVAIRVGESPNARRAGNIERPIMPHRPRWQGHLVGKHGAFVEVPISIRIF